MGGRPALLVNAVELLRQPGLRRHVDTAVTLADVAIDDPRVSGDVAVDVTLESTIADIVVDGTLSVAWADECRRCLQPLAEVLVIAIEERYTEPDPTGPSHDVRSLGDSLGSHRRIDADAFPIEHGQIDLAPMVREEVLLAVPDAPLCRPDCSGLCPTCGADRNAGSCGCDTEVRDDRWSALDELKLED